MDQQPAQNYEPMDMQSLISEYRIAETYTKNYTNDFVALDNLVDGVPVSQQKDAPYVGDTTLAGLVRSIPRESLQQLPVFSAKVNGSKYTIPAIIASYILRRGVFNEDTFGKGLLSTMQIGAEQALTHGYAPFMTATGQMFDEFGTTMRVLHYADCAPEPGIQDANEAGCFYVVANLTKTRLKKILKSAIANPDTSWNVEALQRLADMQPSVENYSIYQSDPRRKAAASAQAATYKFITQYEVGRGGKFITFCPQVEDAALRVIENKSKFGYPRVQFLVIDPAPLTPFGTSRVRLASPGQNLMNAYYQNIASMLLLNSNPPVLQRGRFTKPVQLKQGARWTTLDQNAKAELVTMDNGALESFVQINQQMSSQINTMMGKGGKPTNAGNTAPGAKAQIKYDDTSTNQITNILENFLRQYALVALDTYISEQSGEDELLLDDEAKEAINLITPDAIGDDNKLTINWDDYYRGPLDPATQERTGGIESLGVEIELSIGKDELDEKTKSDLQDMLTVMTQNADPNDPNQRAKINEVENRLLEKSIPGIKPIASSPPAIPPASPAVQNPQEQMSPDQVSTNTMAG